MTFPELLKTAVENEFGDYGSIPYLIEDFLEIPPLEDEMVDHRRWEITHRAVYAHEGKFWAVHYSRPATEYQEGGDFDGYTVYEVIPHEVTSVKYIKL